MIFILVILIVVYCFNSCFLCSKWWGTLFSRLLAICISSSLKYFGLFSNSTDFYTRVLRTLCIFLILILCWIYDLEIFSVVVCIIFFVACIFFKVACGMLVPWSWIEPMFLAVKTCNPRHWNTRKFPYLFILWTNFFTKLLGEVQLISFFSFMDQLFGDKSEDY